MIQYVVTLEPAFQSWEGYVPDVPHCSAGGETESEALERTRQELASYARTRREKGLSLPKPITEIVDVATHPLSARLGDFLILAERRGDDIHLYTPDIIGIHAGAGSLDDALSRFADELESYLERARWNQAPLPVPTIRATVVSV